jgi:hypothetical protein
MQLGAETVKIPLRLDCCNKLTLIDARVVSQSDTADGHPCLRRLVEIDTDTMRRWAAAHVKQHEDD